MPAITKPNLHFDVRSRAGNGVSPSAVVTDLNFQPGLIWTKARNSVDWHSLSDNMRGNTANLLATNSTDGDNLGSSGGWVQSIDTNGFTTRAGSTDSSNVNKSGINYIDWIWKNGGTAVTNTNGTISAQVSANPTAGFSIVTWTGNGSSSATVGHGLGAVPAMIITKERNGGDYWHVKHKSTTTNTNLYLNVLLASTSAASVGDGVLSDLSSNTTFGFATAGSPGNVVAVNETGINNIAYCWSEIPGYSSFGSYTGNGSTDGPFVYLGFRPKFLMLKKTSNATNSNWLMQDTSRETYNASNYATLAANSSSIEPQVSAGSFEGNFIDYLSNGFKIRSSGSNSNESSSNYIYMAFAEAPFKFANAR
jgi:hypothetical protein